MSGAARFRCSRCKQRLPGEYFLPMPNGGRSVWCGTCLSETAHDAPPLPCKNAPRPSREERAFEAHMADPRVRMLTQARVRAKRDGYPCTVTLDDFTIPSHCPVLGVPLRTSRGRSGPSGDTPSLDKIVPALGYVPGNVVVVSYRANFIKSDATPEELTAVANYYSKTAVFEAPAVCVARPVANIPQRVCTLGELAAATGFSRDYISRWFHKNPFGILAVDRKESMYKRKYTSIRILPAGTSAFLGAHAGEAVMERRA